MKVSRRGFVGGALAFGAFGAFGASGAEPRLKFGVMSDVHIGSKPDAEATAEKALRWFASENVDAVLCPGDIAHSGLIQELEKHRMHVEAKSAGRDASFVCDSAGAMKFKEWIIEEGFALFCICLFCRRAVPQHIILIRQKSRLCCASGFLWCVLSFLVLGHTCLN